MSSYRITNKNYKLGPTILAALEAANEQLPLGTLLQLDKTTLTVELADGLDVDVVSTAISDYGEVTCISVKTVERSWFVRVNGALSIGDGIKAGTGATAGIAVVELTTPVAFIREASTAAGVTSAYNV